MTWAPPELVQVPASAAAGLPLASCLRPRPRGSRAAGAALPLPVFCSGLRRLRPLARPSFPAPRTAPLQHRGQRPGREAGPRVRVGPHRPG